MKRALMLNGLLAVCLIVLPSLFAQSERTFTLEELAKYNGKNGAKAYVAVNGVVYDVSNSPSWNMGKHLCPGAIAGKDITPLWNHVPRSHQSPDFLKDFPIAGRLVSRSKKAPTPTPNVNRVKKPVPQPVRKAASHSKLYIWAGIAGLAVFAFWLMIRSNHK